MRKSKNKTALSLMLALAVASVFTMSSFAASKARDPTTAASLDYEDKGLLGLPTGKVIGTGEISVDGNEAENGVTVLSGSTVATGADGNATIELGSLGRVKLLPNSMVTVTLSPNMVVLTIGRVGRVIQSLPSDVIGRVRIQGEEARLAVEAGQVEVKSSEGQRVLSAGQETAFGQTTEAIANGGAVFMVEGGSRQASNTDPQTSHKGGYATAGAGGILVLVGVAAAITGGVLYGSNNGTIQAEVPPKPSQVVP